MLLESMSHGMNGKRRVTRHDSTEPASGQASLVHSRGVHINDEVEVVAVDFLREHVANVEIVVTTAHRDLLRGCRNAQPTRADPNHQRVWPVSPHRIDNELRVCP